MLTAQSVLNKYLSNRRTVSGCRKRFHAKLRNLYFIYKDNPEELFELRNRMMKMVIQKRCYVIGCRNDRKSQERKTNQEAIAVIQYMMLGLNSGS